MSGAQNLLLAAVVLTGLVVLCARIGAKRAGARLQIERKRLMTASELRFWHVMVAALPRQAVLAQVSMGALLKPRENLSRRDWWSNYGRFSQKIVDFVVVDRATAAVVAVVELDDRSHDEARDAARDAILAEGGYPVIRFHVGDHAGVDDIEAAFAGLLGRDRRRVGSLAVVR